MLNGREFTHVSYVSCRFIEIFISVRDLVSVYSKLLTPLGWNMRVNTSRSISKAVINLQPLKWRTFSNSAYSNSVPVTDGSCDILGSGRQLGKNLVSWSRHPCFRHCLYTLHVFIYNKALIGNWGLLLVYSLLIYSPTNASINVFHDVITLQVNKSVPLIYNKEPVIRPYIPTDIQANDRILNGLLNHNQTQRSKSPQKVSRVLISFYEHCTHEDENYYESRNL